MTWASICNQTKIRHHHPAPPQETRKDRLGEIPQDKRLMVVCNSGVRSYEALRQLETAGLGNAMNLQGGVAALKKSGLLAGEEQEEKD